MWGLVTALSREQIVELLLIRMLEVRRLAVLVIVPLFEYQFLAVLLLVFAPISMPM